MKQTCRLPAKISEIITFQRIIVKFYDTKTYVYAWAKDGKMTVVEPNGGETSTLYDNIKLANIVEGQGIEGTDLDVVNTDVTIQSDNVKATDPASVWKIASGQQAAK